MGVMRHQAAFLGVIGAAVLLFSLLPALGSYQKLIERRCWRKRLDLRIALSTQSRPDLRIRSVLDLIDLGLVRLYRTGPGRFVFSLWCDAGLDSKPLLFTLSWLGIWAAGGFIYRCTALNMTLSAFITALLMLTLFAVIFFRAKINRELFQNQLPDTLDRLAGSLQAGFSLPQAVGFIAANLPEPSAAEMSRVYQHIQLGCSVVDALRQLQQRHACEEVRLLVEGLSLQHQVGGNLAEMMFEMAEIVRTKVALKNQVQTLTAQGRVSAIVLASLIPASLGLLSLFPGYVDALLDTRAGNLALIAAGCLELIGAAIILQLIKVER